MTSGRIGALTKVDRSSRAGGGAESTFADQEIKRAKTTITLANDPFRARPATIAATRACRHESSLGRGPGGTEGNLRRREATAKKIAAAGPISHGPGSLRPGRRPVWQGTPFAEDAHRNTWHRRARVQPGWAAASNKVCHRLSRIRSGRPARSQSARFQGWPAPALPANGHRGDSVCRSARRASGA